MLFIPAHIWTPWFSVLGEKSGFDTIEECFEDLTSHIHAVETGLSSDPPLNWMCSILDKFTLISNSDAHSPEKLGRNANIFNTDLSYTGIINALKKPTPETFHGTIDLFPQEGKYHFDGHRKCKIRWNPVQTLQHNGICPVCGKKVTVGVMNRIAQLADREPHNPTRITFPYHSIIPLKEIISELEGLGVQSKRVDAVYRNMLMQTESELNLLLNLPLEEISKIGGSVYAEAIQQVRTGQIFIQEGFDGEFGKISVFPPEDSPINKSQKNMFLSDVKTSQSKSTPAQFDLSEYRKLTADNHATPIIPAPALTIQQSLFPLNSDPVATGPALMSDLNREQIKAATHSNGPALIIAGPGTGKTKTLTAMIANLIQNKSVPPQNILAITFTNKAATEMKNRLETLKPRYPNIQQVDVTTFHSFGYRFLEANLNLTNRSPSFLILSQTDQNLILKTFCDCNPRQLKTIRKKISQIKESIGLPDAPITMKDEIFLKYESCLEKFNAFDLQDLITIPLTLLLQNAALRNQYSKNFRWIFIDEYQDLNASQYRLMTLLADEKSPNLIAIGDPDQAIYGFRGADVKYITSFKTDFPDAAIYNLNQSYRCSQTILNASRNILSSDSQETSLVQGLRDGVKIQLSTHPSPASEAEFVAHTIEKMMGGLRFYSMDSAIASGEEDIDITSLADFTVLCRTKQQFPDMETAFLNHSIPYRKASPEHILDQEPAHSIAAIIYHLLQPDHHYFSSLAKNSGLLSEIEFQTLQKFSSDCEVRELLTYLFDLPALKNELFLREIFMETSATTIGGLAAFLKKITLDRQVDHLRYDMEAVQLMTLHASKGLEFKTVFIIGCEEGFIPLKSYPGQPDNTAEERRLLYVGMTRAKSYLYLSHALKHTRHNRTQVAKPSPFLMQIEKNLLEIHESEFKPAKRKENRQLSLFE